MGSQFSLGHPIFVDVRCNNRAVWIRDPECTLKIKHKKGALDGMNWAFLHTKFKLGGEEE